MLGNVTVSLLGKWVRARVVPAACVALPACTEGRIAHTHTHALTHLQQPLYFGEGVST